MKNLLSFILLSCTIHESYSQHITGIIQSEEDGLGIEGAHIVNISKNLMAISSELGNFRIEGETADTLMVSNINYVSKQFIYYGNDKVSILLKPNLIQLEEVIVSNLPKTANDFRKKLIAMPMQHNDQFIPFGVTPGKARSEIPPLYDRDISGIKYKFSGKRTKEKVKYYRIKADLDDSIIRNKKYNRELVASLTGLEVVELTSFINYMKLSKYFLDSSSAYEIAERIKEEFEEYQAVKN
ncbi:hypothetical protein [Marivirga harenae]|uniref:hypothetical protein n=1 Tax=Marivirga harenae TaxID=2010992 RepID=UPI0026E0DAD6|nr:hypothetical protein [Marivirga harenae]WKV12585.1 hypothetical protein Q3Y49_01895 [Marivirga harenae]|tara:strand:- start:51946 stop:52665 length:720 start_codon:yes stop_codon:yes gene_type:complete